MNVISCLIVDDDALKTERLRRIVQDEVGESAVLFTLAASANEAIRLLKLTAFDLLLIDVNLPLRNSENPARDGGLKLLRQISRGTNGIIRPAIVVGVTGYEDLVRDSAAEFARQGWSLIQYLPESSVWEEAIVNQCRHAIDIKARYSATSSKESCDVCVLTALNDTELEAVLRLPAGFKTVALANDDSRYSMGVIQAGNRQIRVVACSAPEMGNAASATMTSKLAATFRPKLCVMLGICAGIDAEIGDVAVAEFSLHYESGKYSEGEGGEAVFLPQPRYQPASNRVLEAVRRYKIEKAADIMSLPAEWPGNKAGKIPEIKIGPIASGASVVENKEMVKDLKFRDRKLIGLEMESYGFYLACRYAGISDMEFVMMKGVCDKGRPPKKDDHQKYSAFLSATFFYRFLVFEAQVAGGILNCGA